MLVKCCYGCGYVVKMLLRMGNVGGQIWLRIGKIWLRIGKIWLRIVKDGVMLVQYVVTGYVMLVKCCYGRGYVGKMLLRVGLCC